MRDSYGSRLQHPGYPPVDHSSMCRLCHMEIRAFAVGRLTVIVVDELPPLPLEHEIVKVWLAVVESVPVETTARVVGFNCTNPVGAMVQLKALTGPAVYG